MTAGTAAVRAIRVVLTPIFLRALYLCMHPPRLHSLLLNPAVDLLLPPTVSVPSSLEMVAMLVLSVLVASMTAAAMEGLEATTLDFLAETSMSMASSRTCTAKSMAWASSLIILPGNPAMERVRSST